MYKYLVIILMLTGCNTSNKDALMVNTVAVQNGLGMGGTAFSVRAPSSSKHYLVTNAHVCFDEYATIYFKVNKEQHSRIVLGFFSQVDLCVIDYDIGHGLPIAESIEVGEKVAAMGFPYLAVRQLSYGNVGELVDYGFMYSTTARIYPGNSGSAVVNSNNEVVGVMRAINLLTNESYFIPYTYLEAAINLVEERAKKK